MAKDPSTLANLVFICTGKDCKKRGAKEIYNDTRSLIRSSGCSRDVRVLKLKCNDYCKQGPVVILMPQQRWLMGSTPAEIRAEIEASICAPLREAKAR